MLAANRHHLQLNNSDDEPSDGSTDPLTGVPAGTKGPRIRCPLCAWEPDGKKYWQCERCFARFDTFATAAHCPDCDNSWSWTQCIRCGETSDHDAWYVEDEDEAP